jgi:predicted alpha/beta hydrolase family esterase
VRGALLVAPGDVERADLRRLPGWAPVLRQAPAVSARCWWPAATTPTARSSARQELASAWAAASSTSLGALGHINAESGLGDWPEGHGTAAIPLMKD